MNAFYNKADMPLHPVSESNPMRALVHNSDFPLIVLILIHPFLALAMSGSSFLATTHAISTIFVGFVLAVFGKGTNKVGYVAAYMVGAEVLWRMTNAGVYWEVGKYAVSAVFLISLVKNHRLNILTIPTLYFLLLLPSIVYTVASKSFSDARSLISFNLSGPFSLMVCAWFFTAVSLTRVQLQRMIMVFIAPVTGVAAITIYNTLNHRSIFFTDESNFVTSGGFGPNQVSSILGLATLLIFLYMLAKQNGHVTKIFLFLLLLIFAFQSALTFSRNGLYLAGAGMVIASLFLSSNTRVLFRNIFVFLMIYLISQFLFLPWADSFTQGQLVQRFRDLSLTGRNLIAQSDWVIWLNNFWLGVGPGMSDALHSLYFRASASHVEFTRLLAEHGFLGLLSLLLLFVMGGKSFLQTHGAINKAIVAALLVWFFTYLAANAMRLVAPSFLFGLAMNRVFGEESVP